MSFLVSGQPLTLYDQLTANTAKTLYTASKRTTVVSIACTETNGGTQTLSIYVSLANSGGDRYLRKVKPVTARERVLIDEVFALNTGDVLKAQSGDASGYFDVMVTYLAPDAQSSR
ncbi:MAG: hypothetical protein EOO12_00215 [Chitinophagaceae bacterium]|nr:MAG: hypothetical protein EOO12_00215 [Chitinophagaceae bacterium]